MIQSSNISSISRTSFLSSDDIVRPNKRRKIILLGAPGVGKSAMIIRFKDDIFLDYYEPTIQNNFKKFITFHEDIIELEIVDIDGQTEYTIFSFSKLTFGIHGYILCYSIENRRSFELIKIIHSKLVNLVGRDIPKVLVANKSDLTNRRQISTEEGEALAIEMDCPFLECSAKSKLNLNKVFYTLLVEIEKYENNVNLKGISCKRVLEFFARREFLMTIFFCILTVFNFIFGILFLIYGFYIGIISFFNNTVKLNYLIFNMLSIIFFRLLLDLCFLSDSGKLFLLSSEAMVFLGRKMILFTM